MARIHYVGANGAELPLSELEKEKLKGQQLANDIAQTKLRRLHEEVLEKSEVRLVNETTIIVLRQELMRAPSQAVTDLRGFNLSRELLFTIRMSLDKTVRSLLDKAEVSLRRALKARGRFRRDGRRRAAVEESHRQGGSKEGSRQRKAPCGAKGGSVNMIPIDELDRDLGRGLTRKLSRHALTMTCRGGARLANSSPRRRIERSGRTRIVLVTVSRDVCYVDIAADLLLFRAGKMR